MTTEQPRRLLGGGPWLPADRRRLAILLALSVAMLVVASVGAERQEGTEDQLVYGTAGVMALALLCVAVISWLTVGRRSVGLRMALLLGQPRSSSAPASAGVADAGLVAVRSGRRFHRSDCAMVLGKPTDQGSLEAHLAAGLVSCDLCGSADA